MSISRKPIMKNLTCLFILGLLAPGLLHAMDDEGDFAIKGAGATRCAQFTEMLDAESPEVYLYAGWLDGYLTGVNQFQKKTFDVAPWQATELLAQLLGQFCRQNPEAQFIFAATQMLRSMFPARLRTSSEVVEMNSGENTAFLYKAVLQRVQEALVERGHDIATDGAFGPQTQRAIEDVQRDNDIEVSGLPDQRTLLLLLQESSFTGAAAPDESGSSLENIR